jgi:hypothetical protein
MNCFTLESSFFGYFSEKRETVCFSIRDFEKVGEILAKSLFDYVMLKEEEERMIA